MSRASLVQENKRPIAVGFFFSMGHSLVLMVGVAAIALTTAALGSRFNNFNDDAGIVGTLVSTGFLLLRFSRVCCARIHGTIVVNR